MDSRRERSGSTQADDKHFTEIPGIGWVPNGPRRQHQHGHRRSSHVEQNANDRPSERQKPEANSLYGFSKPPQFRDPMQYLAEGFARVQWAMREEGRRQQDHRGHRSREAQGEGSPRIKREASEDSKRPINSLAPESQDSPDPDVTPAASPPRERGPVFSATPAADCICPINLDCPRKHNDRIDCRTLVIEFKRWEKKQRDQYHTV